MIHPQQDDTPDFGFRVLKIYSSNMKDVYYRPEEISQYNIPSFIDTIKSDRTPEDLLFQLMLEAYPSYKKILQVNSPILLIILRWQLVLNPP